jgi:hypothetical protein
MVALAEPPCDSPGSYARGILVPELPMSSKFLSLGRLPRPSNNKCKRTGISPPHPPAMPQREHGTILEGLEDRARVR